MPQQDKDNCDMLNIQRQALARNIARQTEQNHRLETAVPGLVLVRYEAPTQPASCMYEPTICLVAQGAKRVMLGDEEYLYDANHYLISSVGLPVVANVVEASPEVPLLGMVLKLDMRMLAQMMVDSNLPVTRAANQLATLTDMKAEDMAGQLSAMSDSQLVSLQGAVKEEIAKRIITKL